MFNTFRELQYYSYNRARNYFRDNYIQLVKLENFLSKQVFQLIQNYIIQIKEDYNEASYLYPFWQNYPPEERGRQPIGDQYPWIEVGEHSLGGKLYRLLSLSFNIRDIGLPAGSDIRVVLSSDKIYQITEGFTNSCWLFVDIKSVGPRDDWNHAVMSHNQISGSGRWDSLLSGITNDVIIACGKRSSHPFYCSIPPIYVLSDGTVVPVVIIILKPVYDMLSLEFDVSDGGQPLSRISCATVPNGLLLCERPNYLSEFPELFFPGKDDKTKNPRKKRCRVSFEILKQIEYWRFREILVS
ncbi:BglI family type II restriction endonuclease [Baaleninema simplex]|uniref:BglI family type II restriction endonuclease n=1 Tax=Baaleninema simplex TaxID=2862350 RepID=UPI00034C1198|nr:BglI family type II restriction endonuclease [Baaleninema simplex]